MLKHIGIAAVSAEGAALCYRTICAEASAVLGPHAHPEITMHTFSMSEHMRVMETDDWAGEGRLLLESARKLAQGGADFLICPDNTSHQGLDLVRHESPLPWLHIAEEVAREAVARGFSRLGILGTRFLMEGPVYPAKLEPVGIAREIPDAAAWERINDIIFGELVPGRFEEPARAYFRQAIEALGERGCDAVVLGCTEIPLLITQADSTLPVLDSTRILARAALREATRA